MNLSHVLLTLVTGILIGCSGNAPKMPEVSRSSSFTVDEYKPSNGSPEWSTMTVDMQRKDAPGPITKKLDRGLFRENKFKEQSLVVPYGRYTIELSYFDANGQLVYRSCEAVRSKEYEIRIPSFRATLDICVQPLNSGGGGNDKPGDGTGGNGGNGGNGGDSGNGGTETPGGNVDFKPTADVTITPILGGSGKPDSGSGGNTGGNPGNAGGNPFIGHSLYVNQTYANSVASSMQREQGNTSLLDKMNRLKTVSTAVWIDRIKAIEKVEPVLKNIRDLQKTGRSFIATFVVYDLPERDCAANASAGELSAAGNGLERYKREYIDVIAQLFARYSDVKIAAIIEPDSLPNMATNMDKPKCVTAAPLYKQGVAYAIQKLGMSHVSLYLDSAHGGWLGWPDNRAKAAKVFKEVLDLAGGSEKIRGFAANVANYSPLRVTDATRMNASYYNFNPAVDELTFIELLSQDLAREGIKNRNFVIDTSRNGNPQARTDWGNWCNIASAGIGERPKIAPASGVDAYLWIKPPGESDGIATSGGPRFDWRCQSADSMSGAPEAGEWFHAHFKSLVMMASPAL